ncbi:MAG: 5'-nucleotidase C-terminal domain-containing protein [Thermodesulfobacteriota bacterium]
MKTILCKITFTSIAIIMVSFLLIIFSLPASAEELVILHSNDTHSNLFPFGPHNEYGGIARMSTMIKELKSENDYVIALHAGDMFVGTFAFNKYLGYPEFKIMEGLYDAMALGNHEFDLGPDVLGYILAGFNPITSIPFGPPVSLPLLCANGNFSSLPMLDSFVEPSMIKDFGNFKVGLVGVVTPNPIYYSQSTAALFSDPYAAAGMTAAMLRAMGCQVVIAVSHLGQAYDMLGLSDVPGIDIIVGGHSHDYLPATVVGGKIIVQAGEFGKFLGELRVDVDTSSSGGVTLLDHTIHSIDRKVHKDPTILSYLNELREGIYEDPRFGPVYSRHLAKAMWDHENKWLDDDPYQKLWHRDTPLGNLVTDAIRTGVTAAGYTIDFAIEVNGGIGHKLYAGKVVGNDLMQVLSYGYDPVSGLGFKIKIVNLHAFEILYALEYTVSMVEYTDDFSPQISGLTFEYDATKPSFSRVDMSSIEINGQPINLAAWYAIALNEKILEFMATLGIDITVPGRVIDPYPDLLEFNLAEDYMRQLNKLKYTSEGRIIDTSELP